MHFAERNGKIPGSFFFIGSFVFAPALMPLSASFACLLLQQIQAAYEKIKFGDEPETHFGFGVDDEDLDMPGIPFMRFARRGGFVFVSLEDLLAGSSVHFSLLLFVLFLILSRFRVSFFRYV